MLARTLEMPKLMCCWSNQSMLASNTVLSMLTTWAIHCLLGGNPPARKTSKSERLISVHGTLVTADSWILSKGGLVARKTVILLGTAHRVQGAERGICNIEDPDYETLVDQLWLEYAVDF